MLKFASAHKHENNSQITADVVAKVYNLQDIALNTLQLTNTSYWSFGVTPLGFSSAMLASYRRWFWYKAIAITCKCDSFPHFIRRGYLFPISWTTRIRTNRPCNRMLTLYWVDSLCILHPAVGRHFKHGSQL